MHQHHVADRLSVSIVLPAFNEGAILRSTLTKICAYMERLEELYRWELVVVNDGSTDDTGKLADEYSATRKNVRVVHHPTNLGLGRALVSGFNYNRAAYVVVIDADLSYSLDHIEPLLDRLRASKADIVVASPYANGGRVSRVPVFRRLMSLGANRYLSSMAGNGLSTFTGMVRAYDGPFIRAMSLRACGQDISLEIIYKAMLVGARIEEIPAHLDWSMQRIAGCNRSSSMKVVSHGISTMLSGFMLRPDVIFLLPATLLAGIALSINTLMVFHFYTAFQSLGEPAWLPARASLAVGLAYQSFPHTFAAGGLFTLLTVQVIGFVLLSTQNRRYFEDVYHLAGAMRRECARTQEPEHGLSKGQLNG